MKKIFSILAFIIFWQTSQAQFADSAALNNFIRNTINDKRPAKITASQLQEALLGISNSIHKLSNDSSFINKDSAKSVTEWAVWKYFTNHAAGNIISSSFDTTTRVLTLTRTDGSTQSVVIPAGASPGASGITALSNSRSGDLITVSGDNGDNTTFNVNDKDSATRVHLPDSNVVFTTPYQNGLKQDIIGNIGDTSKYAKKSEVQADSATLQNAIALKANTLSPTLTGTPTTPTPVNTDSSGAIPSTAYVKNVVSAYFKLPALTNGSILFSDGTTISQNNSYLWWDNTNKYFGVGTKTPASISEFRANGSANNSPSVVVTFNNRTIGTATAGSGIANQWKSQSDAAYDRLMAQQWITWVDATDATRRAQWVDYLYNPSGAGKKAISRILQPDNINIWVGINLPGVNNPGQALEVYGKAKIDTIPAGAPNDNLVTVNGSNNILSQIPASTFVQPSTLLVDTVQTITALENYTPSTKTAINTIVVKDAKRGGIFNRITTGTPDSMTVFNCYSGGFWQRQFKGDYHILWAGADPTGVTDNTTLINFLLSTGLPNGSTLYVDAGIYNAATGLTITRVTNIKGAGRVSSTLKSTGVNPTLTFASGVNEVTIRDLTLSGNGTANWGADATNGNGVVFNANFAILFENVTIMYNGGYGVYADSSGNTNNIYFNGCSITRNKKSGVHMIGVNGANQVNAIYFNQSGISNNSKNGLELYGASINVNNCDIEGNLLRGVVINSDSAVGTYAVHSVTINENHFEGNDSGFILIKANNDVRGLSINDNYGLYDSTPGGGVAHAGINLVDIQSPSFTTYTNSHIQGFHFENNDFSFNGIAPNSFLNGNNVLAYSSTVKPSNNNDISNLKNLGEALIVYTPTSNADSSHKTPTTAIMRQLYAATQTQLKAKADTGSTNIYTQAPVLIDTVANPGHITIKLDTANMPGLRPYKVYTALLNQTGTSAPTATVLENTTGATFTWSYTSAGNYTVTASSGVLTSNKTAITVQNGSTFTPLVLPVADWGSTTISHVKVSATNTGTLTDSSLSNAMFEIRIYP